MNGETISERKFIFFLFILFQVQSPLLNKSVFIHSEVAGKNWEIQTVYMQINERILYNKGVRDFNIYICNVHSVFEFYFSNCDSMWLHCVRMIAITYYCHLWTSLVFEDESVIIYLTHAKCTRIFFFYPNHCQFYHIASMKIIIIHCAVDMPPTHWHRIVWYKRYFVSP